MAFVVEFVRSNSIMTGKIGEPIFPIEGGNYKMDAEPDVRIGVVLAEDAKTSIDLQLPHGRFRVVAPDSTRTGLNIGGASGGKLMAFARDSGQVELLHEKSGAIVCAGKVVRIEPIIS